MKKGCFTIIALLTLGPLYAQRRVTLKDVTVTGRAVTPATTATYNTLSGATLDATKGGTLADAIRRLPGISMLQTGTSIAKPVIHGLHSNRVLVLNNGIRQEGQQWGAEHAPEIDPFIAQRITVIKGAAAVRYGADAIGGVVIVEPPVLPTTAALHGELNMAGASNGRGGALSGMLDGGIKKLPGFGWRVQGTLKQAGNTRTADYYLDNTGVRERNFSAAAGYAGKRAGAELFFSHFNTEIGIFRGAHIGSLADLHERLQYGRPYENGAFSYHIDAPRQHIRHNLLKAKAYLDIKESLRLRLQYGLQRNNRQEFDIRRGGRTSLPALDLVLTTHTLDLALEAQYRAGWSAAFGLNGLSQVNNSVPGTFATPVIPNYDAYGAGAYAVARKVKPRYELEAGLRYDYKRLDALGYDKEGKLYGGLRTFHNLSGSAGVIWRPDTSWSLRSSLGTAWRAPAVNELFSNGLHHGVAAVERGNSSLRSEQSFQWTNTLEYQNNRLAATLTVYANFMKGYIYLHPSMDTLESLRGAFPVFDYRQTDARFLGADLFAQYRFCKALEYELKGAVVRAKDVSRGQYLPWIPADRLENTIRYHINTGKKLRDTYLQLQSVLAARQSRYEPASDYAPPPAGYHLLHLGAGTKWLFAQQSLHLAFSVDNIGNTLYKEYMNRFRYYAHDAGRSFTLRATCRF